MVVENIKRNASCSGEYENMHWYYLEGDLYIEVDGPLDMTGNLEFNAFIPQDYSEEHLTYPEYAYPWEQVKNEIVQVYIADGCTAIRWRSFCKHKNLSKVSIPKSVKEIEWRAFGYCESLEHIELPDGVEIIAEQAFVGCVSLQYLSLPDSLKKIGAVAFASCGKLDRVVIPNGIEEIGIGAFSRAKQVVAPKRFELKESNPFLGVGEVIYQD